MLKDDVIVDICTGNPKYNTKTVTKYPVLIPSSPKTNPISKLVSQYFKQSL